jgi:hypothetical protein
MFFYSTVVACLAFFQLSTAASVLATSPEKTLTTLATNILPIVPALTWWKPQPLPGLKWQIILEGSLGNLALPGVSVYEVDLDNTSKANIKKLHDNGKTVICYFSAGSFEDFRPDKNIFRASDIGNKLNRGLTAAEGYWPGERWLNIKSPIVLAIMLARIAQAKEKGCDAIDPDNIDGYAIDLVKPIVNGFNPKTGFNLVKEDAIRFLTKLATAAHTQGLAIALKNAVEILPRIESLVDFAINEQCVDTNECPLFHPFIARNKAVFHLEYSDGSVALESMASATVRKYCASGGETKFSTVLKDRSLLSKARWCDGTSTN